MSVRIVESENKSTGQGWQVSRRAFLAQTSALLVAMGIPAKRAAALAGQLYQTKEQALAGTGYVDEVLMAISSKVTDAVDPSGAASVQLLIKKLYDDAGLKNFDAQVDLEDYVKAAGNQTVSALLGGQAEGATVADVLARVASKDVLRSMEKGLEQATAQLNTTGALPAELAKVLSGALSSEDFVKDAAANEPLFVYQDPERALLAKMLEPLHESRTRIEATVPNGSVSVGLGDHAGKLHSDVLNVVVSNWLESQYDEAEFSDARALAQALIAKPEVTLPLAEKLAETTLAFNGSNAELVAAGAQKVRALINDPSALHGALEDDLAKSQAELDEVLTKIDALSKELTGQPLQLAENVPGTRYVLANVDGLTDKVAQERVDELNRLNERAGDLSKKVIDVQFQMEDLNVQASDGRAVEEKLLALEHAMTQAAETLDKATSALRQAAEIEANSDTLGVKAQMAAAVEEAYGIVERNKELADASVSPVDWAIQKAAAAQFLVQGAQMAKVIGEGLHLKGGETAMAEALHMFGRWNNNAPAAGIEELCKEQLAYRTDNALKATSAFATKVKAGFEQGMTGMNADRWNLYVANVISSTLGQADEKLDATLESLGLGASSTVAEVAAAAGSAVPTHLDLKGVQENIFVAGVSRTFADALLAAAKEDAAADAIFSKMNPAEIAGSNVHVLGFQALSAFAHEPVSGALANYLKTLVAGAFGEGQVSLAAYADIAPERVESIMAKAHTTQAIVAAVKEPLAEAGHGLVGLLVPNLLAGFSTFSRDIVVRQSKGVLKIDVQ